MAEPSTKKRKRKRKRKKRQNHKHTKINPSPPKNPDVKFFVKAISISIDFEPTKNAFFWQINAPPRLGRSRAKILEGYGDENTVRPRP